VFVYHLFSSQGEPAWIAFISSLLCVIVKVCMCEVLKNDASHGFLLYLFFDCSFLHFSISL